MSTVSINHPDYRPGRGQKRSDREIVLYAEAAQVWAVWQTIYGNRVDGRDTYAGVHRDALATTIAAGGVLGTLLSEFVADAETRTLPKPWTVRDKVAETAPWINYTVAGLLRDRRIELTAPAAVTVPADDTCSHGVSFTDICTECEV